MTDKCHFLTSIIWLLQGMIINICGYFNLSAPA